jgi:choline dehydrogenase-like flavoprotein
MREGIKLSRKLANSESFAKYKGAEVFPGSHIQTDDELDLYIRNSAHTSNALVGTCKMGVCSDPMSVVATDLRVHGLKGTAMRCSMSTREGKISSVTAATLIFR